MKNRRRSTIGTLQLEIAPGKRVGFPLPTLFIEKPWPLDLPKWLLWNKLKDNPHERFGYMLMRLKQELNQVPPGTNICEYLTKYVDKKREFGSSTQQVLLL